MGNQKIVAICCKWWGELEYKVSGLPQADAYFNMYRQRVDPEIATHLLSMGQAIYLNNRIRVVAV